METKSLAKRVHTDIEGTCAGHNSILLSMVFGHGQEGLKVRSDGKLPYDDVNSP